MTLTLEDYRKSRYEDLFLAVVAKEITWNEAEKVRMHILGYNSEITPLDALRASAVAALIENSEPVTKENIKRVEEEVKTAIGTNLEECYYIILWKKEEEYIDLSQMNKLESGYKIKCQIPFKEYYKEGEYSFEEDEEGPYLNIDMEPFEKFTRDYKNGKFTKN